MKTFGFLLVITFFIAGCASVEELKYVPREQKLTGIDFSKYSSKGFLITPEKYLGDYESVGLISYEFLPSGNYAVVGEGTIPNSSYNPFDPSSTYYLATKKWVFESINIEQVMDSVYSSCSRMGADALVNFQINSKSDVVGANAINPANRFGYVISGFAIKRD